MSVLKHDNLVTYQQRAAHHEAGHATAIHCNNVLNHLPPVYFQIIFKNIDVGYLNSKSSEYSRQDSCIAKIKGGRLLQTLPLTSDELMMESFLACDKKVIQDKGDYRLAFEADIVNLLIGPLAEAKYCHQQDNELFAQPLFTVQSLQNYGGETDIALVNDYLNSYPDHQQERHSLLDRLFSQAFNFINDTANWLAICKLARHILNCQQTQLTCMDVAAVLER